MQPRLRLDIDWRSIAHAFRAAPPREPLVETEARIGELFAGGKHAVSGLSVRTLWDAWLHALGPRDGDEVLMSGVNIGHMEEIVRRAGYVPRFVDIEEGTLAPSVEDVSRAITPRTRLFLLTHLFGARANAAPFAEECRRRSVLFAEDAAQALCADGYGGHPDADAAFFSFGFIKTQTALAGGIALFRERGHADSVRDAVGRWTDMPADWWSRRVRKAALLKIASTPAIFARLVGSIQRSGRDPDSAIQEMARGFSGADLLECIRHRAPAHLPAFMERRIATADPQRFAARGQCARDFLARIELASWIGCKAPVHTHWIVPVRVRDPKACVEALRAQGFDATRGASALRSLGTESDPTPRAEDLMRSIVYLPVRPDVPADERERLARLVDSWLVR